MFFILFLSAVSTPFSLAKSELSTDCKGHLATCSKVAKLEDCGLDFIDELVPSNDTQIHNARKCICGLNAELAKCIIAKDANCEAELKNEAGFKEYESSCSALGVSVLENSENASTGNDSTIIGNSAMHVSTLSSVIVLVGMVLV